MKIKKESDVLRREYKNLSRVAERLTRKDTYDKIEPAMNEIFQRQSQIIKELEECTGIQITLKTREDILKEIEEMRRDENDEYKGNDKK
jgi:peptide subunit release factor 1 (eRF1)